MAIAGVPSLLKNAPKAIGITLLGNLVSGLWNYLFPGATWGIFVVGTTDAAVEVSSVYGIDISGEARNSNYIIQSGSFTNYNKVQMPNVTAVRITKDGGEAERSQLLKWLDQNVKDTALFDVLTPEFRYSSMTLAGYRMGRSAQTGAAMIIVDCLFEEIRIKPAVYSSNTIEKPEDQPTTPTARVFAAPPDKPIEVGGPIAWR